MAKMIYWGLFFPTTTTDNSLSNVVKFQHITFGFKVKPPVGLNGRWGRIAETTIIGYGNDGENEGYKIELHGWKKFYRSNATPHITISVSENGKPVNTGKIKFDKCEEIDYTGRWGWFGSDGKVHFEKPEEF